MAQTETASTPNEVKYSEKEKEQILEDYRMAVLSREASVQGRREVLTGKAKFGIFGDGKELPQIAMSKVFRDGDFRSGYYRDQTFMMAIGGVTVREFFAQLYAHPDVEADPSSAGRQMNGHFATRSLNPDGSWKDLTKMKNTSADISPTAGQMARMLGLAQASKVYRLSDDLGNDSKFSNNGNEVVFGTIGDSSTSEGVFWETVNAAGVLEIPLILSVWDDGYGISVPKEYQTTKSSISKVMRGFQRTKHQNGLEIIRVKAWDYEALLEAYEEAERVAREEHAAVLVHVTEVTQPQGHSTSGSHERYKSDERLEWEEEHCCNRKFREYILSNELATEEELEEIEDEAKEYVSSERQAAWQAVITPIKDELKEVVGLIRQMEGKSAASDQLEELRRETKSMMFPIRKDVLSTAKKALRAVRGEDVPGKSDLIQWVRDYEEVNKERYDTYLHSESEFSPLNVEAVAPVYPEEPEMVDGRVVLRDNFDALMSQKPEIVVFGEDSGKLGDVNKGLEGLQEKYGKLRVSDTGIREATIVGQGIGMAMRGLRPIAEIQYLDYLLYAFYVLSDDLATVHYRTKGGQKCPLIVRTRGHRLEGIWHSGSPMGIVINGLRGVHVCVPRNLTTAAGLYNTLMQGDDPALIVEPLNAYRLKEKLPENLGEFTVPLGIPEIVREGTDLTIVSYGSTCNICEQVLDELDEVDISAELIDVRTLLPFDRNSMIAESLKKTNRVLFVDEDMPGATTAYMMQQVLDRQQGYFYLDSEPKALSAKNHRPAYGSDGDYFSKPNAEEIFDAVYDIMHEADPKKYPAIYK